MKSLNVVSVRNIKVEFNAASSKNNVWMRIKDADTGVILHTGQPKYIKAIAKKRYGKLIV